MADQIQIKRRTSVTGNAGITLAEGELFYNEVDQILYIGTSAGTTSFDVIGGEGRFVSLASLTQSIAGTKTFSGTINVPDQTAGDNTAKAANTKFVTAAVAAAAGTGAVGNAQLADMAAERIKGRASGAGTGAPQDLTSPQVKAILALVYSDISDFTTGVRLNRLDQMALPTAALDFNGQRVTNLGAPVNANDAARKADIDAAQAGLDFKDSVKAIAVANVAALSGTQTIDGVALNAADRVLLTAQTTASENGIWLVNASTWTRPTDFVGSNTASGGAFVFVEQGTVYSDTSWVCTTNGSINVGTDANNWAQFASSALPGGIPLQIQYGGTGITSITQGALLYGPASGEQLSVLAAGAGGYFLKMNAGGTAPEWTNVIDGGSF